jgi:Phage integrase family
MGALKAHRHLRGPYVFCDKAGQRLTHSKVKRVVPSACAKAGLAKRLTMHGLRHTFASHLVMLGQSLKAVQELLGHTTIDMTMRYAQNGSRMADAGSSDIRSCRFPPGERHATRSGSLHALDARGRTSHLRRLVLPLAPRPERPPASLANQSAGRFIFPRRAA